MSYTGSQIITINFSQVSGTQSNFPVLITGTFAYLATTPTGSIQNTVTLNGQTVPADLVFSTDAGASSLLTWEIASYNASTGFLEAWVNIPSLSSSTNTIIYMSYGNASVTTYQCTATSTWDLNYSGVYHLADGNTLSCLDSTVHANTGTPTSATAITGQVDGGVSFSGTGFINLGSSITLNPAAALLTIECWAKRATSSSVGALVDRQGSYAFDIGVVPATVNQMKMTKYAVIDITISGVPADTAWHHFVGVWSSTGQVLYVDGISVGTAANTANFAGSAFPTYIGRDVADTSNFTGSMDEVRVSSVNRSAGWVQTAFNNQNSPTSFYSMTPGGAPFIWFGASW